MYSCFITSIHETKRISSGSTSPARTRTIISLLIKTFSSLTSFQGFFPLKLQKCIHWLHFMVSPNLAILALSDVSYSTCLFPLCACNSLSARIVHFLPHEVLLPLSLSLNRYLVHISNFKRYLFIFFPHSLTATLNFI